MQSFQEFIEVMMELMFVTYFSFDNYMIKKVLFDFK